MKSAFILALHMHQPIIPAGPGGEPISNLRYMFEHQGEGDNHNAGVFKYCYERVGDYVPQLVSEGKKPRIMLDYSGNLLWGLERMGMQDVLGKLRNLAQNYTREVEFLCTAWGHAVAPSTPPADFRLHVKAWKEYFKKLFGDAALSRVNGFSPSEMALPNHPDLAYEYIKTLREEGFSYMLVQEHTVELPDGSGLRERYIPHQLVCKNTKGETASIIALIKTQGSDTKLVAQMQPYYEAQTLGTKTVAGIEVPQAATQIADGENGGVMMNEFPGKYMEAVRELGSGHGDVQLLSGSEYLLHLQSLGIKPTDLPVCQPIHQAAFWKQYKGNVEEAIAACKKADYRFNMEGGSWTNNISWVKGYQGLLGDMEKASIAFHQKYPENPPFDPTANDNLFNLLCAQTSCFRYWGEGVWPEYGREFCRRAMR
jgi:hypothetical protein